MPKQTKAGEALDQWGGALRPSGSDGVEVRELAPVVSVTMEVDAEFAAELIRISGVASFDEAALLALREGLKVMSARSTSIQKKAVDALFNATDEDFRRTMKFKSAGD